VFLRILRDAWAHGRRAARPLQRYRYMSTTVLVADDDDVTVDIVAKTMERLGFEVSRASDGDELLQQIAEHGPFDLLITDISMPWMTGLQVAHSARAAGLATPLIVMTALQIDSGALTSLGGEAVLLRKPFGRKQLIFAVSQLLQDTRRHTPAQS
jgi:CheY-like chemotaxis protein